MAERAGRGSESEREELYRTYLAQTAYVNNWDLVDVSCGPVVGNHLLDRDRSPLDRLAGSAWLWDRRISIVSTHALLRAGESADTYRLARAAAARPPRPDPQGRRLDAAGGRTPRGPGRAARLLGQHAPELPRTMLRYAIEHLDPDLRAHYRGLQRIDLAR